MYRVSFRNADMRGARFSLDQMGGALVLRSVDFSNANLDEADFTGALYDSDTIFPNGFNPEEKGLKIKTWDYGSAQKKEGDAKLVRPTLEERHRFSASPSYFLAKRRNFI
jgi:Pentapeptide repeats (8 copies)